MRSFLLVILIAGLSLASIGRQGPDRLDAVSLRKTIEKMGYPCKDLNAEAGQEKFEFTLDRGGFNIPIAAELSKSQNYIWLTVSLGPMPADAALPLALLKENAQIQPNNFYVTSKDNLMLGLAIDNRGADSEVFRRVIDKLADDVGGTSHLWSKAPAKN